jgi:D-tyrosyl-tRNA(Tyr) deacylase
MRAVVQRVTEAHVAIDGAVVGAIGPGLCVLVGVTHDDDAARARRLAAKLWNLRILDDDAGVMNRSLADTGGEVLVISQFTLAGDARRGARPSFVNAADPATAAPLVELVARRLRETHGLSAPTSVFGAMMRVGLVNDGPVTIMLDSDELGLPHGETAGA